MCIMSKNIVGGGRESNSRINHHHHVTNNNKTPRRCSSSLFHKPKVLDAVAAGQVEAAPRATLAAAKKETSRRQRRRSTPTRKVSTLMYACQQGDVDVVRETLDVLQSLDRELSHEEVGRKVVWKRDRSGRTALHYCSTSLFHVQSAQIADLLTMAAPDLVDARDEDGFTPLHLAVIAGNMPLVTFLLASKANVAAVDAEKHSVVHWATVCGETEALRAILAAGAPISTPDVHGGYPLHYAAQMCGSYQDKDHELGLVILHTLLSQPGVNVHVRDGDGRQPLLWAASAGSSRAMLALIKAGAAVEASDKDGLTALHCAASRGHTDCLDALLTLCGASVDVIDSNGCTALHYAVTLGHADATALLLAHGAKANRQDRKGRTPAHCGCAKGQFETLKMLHSHSANLWLRNARGDLPLHEAVGSGRRDLVQWLLEMKPSYVNARNNDGRCPLHLAALNDNSDLCKILLDLGASVNPVLRTSKNVFMTPLDCAMQRGFRSTAKYLQLQGGLPASKLSQPTAGTGLTPGAIRVNLHDDITLVGSEGESEEYVKTPQKKKGSKKSEANARKPEVTSVDTEVTLTDRNVLNIQQRRNIKVKDSSSKRATTQGESKTSVSNMTTQTSLERESASIPLKIDENIKEINSLAQSIEAKAKDICKEVSTIEENFDRQSLISCEDAEAKQVVVEASIHAPPRDKFKEDIVNTYQEIVSSLKEELLALKLEIRNLKHADDEMKQGTNNQQLQDQDVSLKDLKVLLEGRIKEIKDTMEEFKSDVFKKDAKGLDVKMMESLKGEIKNLEQSAETIQQSVGESDVVTEESSKFAKEHVEDVKTAQSLLDLNIQDRDSSKSADRGVINQITSEDLKPTEEIQEISDLDNQRFDDQKFDSQLQEVSSSQMEAMISTSPSEAFQILNTASEDTFQVLQSASEQTEATVDTDQPHIQAKSVIMESSMDNDEASESSFSSNATKREHKSFTVLEDETKPPAHLSSKGKERRKLRSRSEESRKRAISKIPVTKENKSEWSRRAKSNLESRIPLLPTLADNKTRFKTKSDTNIHASSSRNREEDLSEDDEDYEKTFQRKSSKKRSKRAAKSASMQDGSDYESSNLIDSGFEPSPRSTRIPKWRNVSNRGVNMTTVTQSIQGNIRRYHLERKIFQQLLELKRLQIRAGVHNESLLVKRAIDAFNRTCAATVGEGRYISKDLSFKSFEKFLYDSLRRIQKNHEPEYLKRLPENSMSGNPLLCTQSTNRCMHATHAYTGVPCAAYLPKMDHHTIPKIGYSSVSCKPSSGFLPNIGKSRPVTLELCHGTDKQIISLPTDRLDQNKRYYVTFTVRGNSNNDSQSGGEENKDPQESPAKESPEQNNI